MNTEDPVDASKPLGDPKSEFLAGEAHNEIVKLLRAVDGWASLSEVRQEKLIDDAERLSRWLVEGAVSIVADKGFDHVQVQLAKFTADSAQIKGTYALPLDMDALGMLGEHNGKKAIVVFADPTDFMGSRSRPKAAPDQPTLPLQGTGGDDATDSENEDDSATDDDDAPAGADPVAAAAAKAWSEMDGTGAAQPQ